jgi:sulfhydrogenase subunit beta (sulfur reductase)
VQALNTTPAVIAPEALDDLIAILQARGFRVLGPRIRDGAIIYDDLSAASQLPIGWTDEQQGGSYRLSRRQDAARFGYAVGPHSWKQFLFRPEVRLWRARRSPDDEMVVDEEPLEAKPMAFIGVRSCELHAIEIQDRVFMGGRHVDRDYANQREGAFLVAVNCITAGGTCFCASMGTGPKASAGYDLALTELLDGEHRFLAEAGTERGAELLAELPQQPATAADLTVADAAIEATSSQMGRTMETDDIRNLLARNLENPRWDEVADRCLSCGNCTQVCPTCFCSSVEDTSDLTGDTAERTRVWDTCFSVDYSHIHGGSIRPSTKARYRQWMTHKLGTWIDQFGTSGCVGCGRCITWCPVAIDITEEVAAIRLTDGGDATAA